MKCSELKTGWPLDGRESHIVCILLAKAVFSPFFQNLVIENHVDLCFNL